MYSVISDLDQCSFDTCTSQFLPFYICIFINFHHFIMCAGLFSFAIIVIEICLACLWLIQFYPNFHEDIFGDISIED